MELIYRNTSYDNVQIKESHATLMLLSILLISFIFKSVSLQIPGNTEPQASTHTTKNQNNDVRKNTPRSWINRYSGGIKFEFYPPN